MSDKPALEGRVAIVTGGARGIGAAISRRLVAEGASVVVADSGVNLSGNDPDPSIAQEFAASLGGGALAYTEDMGIPAAAKQAVKLAVDRFGGIDIVVNNAAILRDAFVFKANTDDWDTVIRNNLSGPFYLLAAATPVMREQARVRRGGNRWGRIVSMVSSAGLMGNYGQAAYASAKGGLLSLMRTAAFDMALAGVTSNAIAAFARTRVTEIIRPANEEQAAYKERAMKVPAEPIAAFVAWLCSEAAQDVTGQLFGVRGRETMVFSQTSPAATAVAPGAEWSLDELTTVVNDTFRPHFTDMRTALEVFNTDPAI